MIIIKREKEIREDEKQFFSRLDKFFSISNEANVLLEKNSFIKQLAKHIEEHQHELVRTIKDRLIADNNIRSSPDKEKCLEKLLDSPYIETACFENGYLVVITKPLKVWKWNWGQYIIKYGERSVYPTIERISQTNINSLIVPYVESEILTHIHAHHPHILSTPCFGDATKLILSFWENYATGFNYCIQYLLTYYGQGAFIRLPHFLALLGYVNDASAIMKNRDKIAFIIDGKFYNSRHEEIPISELKKWGCNGKIVTKKEMEQYIENSRYIKKADAIRKGIKYISQMHKDFDYIESEEYDAVCENCGEGINDPYTIDDTYYCETCYDEVTSICDHCGDRYNNNYISYYEEINEILCESCYEDKTRCCNNCNEIFFIEDLNDTDIGSLCSECYKQYQEDQEEEEQEEEQNKPTIKILSVTKND